MLTEIITKVFFVVIGRIGIINDHILARLMERESEGVGGL